MGEDTAYEDPTERLRAMLKLELEEWVTPSLSPWREVRMTAFEVADDAELGRRVRAIVGGSSSDQP